jgi:hypothetical protein
MPALIGAPPLEAIETGGDSWDGNSNGRTPGGFPGALETCWSDI